jgi:hypothetical protein
MRWGKSIRALNPVSVWFQQTSLTIVLSAVWHNPPSSISSSHLLMSFCQSLLQRKCLPWSAARTQHKIDHEQQVSNNIMNRISKLPVWFTRHSDHSVHASTTYCLLFATHRNFKTSNILTIGTQLFVGHALLPPHQKCLLIGNSPDILQRQRYAT